MADYRAFPTTDGPADIHADGSWYSLGLEFYVNAPARCTHIWFWAPPNPDPVKGSIATAECRLFAIDGTPVSPMETMTIAGTGWQSHALSSPVDLVVGDRYVAAVHSTLISGDTTEESGLGNTPGYWAAGGPGETGIANGILVVPNSSNSTNGQCTWLAGATDPLFPTNDGGGANYWIDVTVEDPDGPSESFEVMASLDLQGTASFLSPAYATAFETTASADLGSFLAARYGTDLTPSASLDLDSSALIIHLADGPLDLEASANASYATSFDVTAALDLAAPVDASYHVTVDVTASMDLRGQVLLFQPGGGQGGGLIVHDLYYVEQQPPPELRVIAQRILDKEWLDWDVPLKNLEITHTLSGPQVIKATIDPEQDYLRDTGMDAYSTYLHVEEDGNIAATGILQPIEPDGEILPIDAFGVSWYPHGIPYGGVYVQQDVDPFDIVRAIWTFVEEQPQGAIHVSVDQHSSPVRIGNEVKDVVGGEEGETEIVPYELVWWKNVDCGEEIDDLAKQIPFDYREHNRWNPDRTEILHTIKLGYPRLGRKREDLIFAQDENLLSLVPYAERQDAYVSQVVVLGAGEGSEMIRGYAGQRQGNRIRRVATVTDKTIESTDRANKRAKDELRRRQASIRGIKEIAVDARHHNARFGSYVPGDDILVEAEVPWIGEIYQWHRILSYTYTPGGDAVRLELQPSESFHYGAA